VALDPSRGATTGYPVLNLFYRSTQSLPAADVTAAVVIINFAASTIAGLAAASRQLWSFARNRGVPFSRNLAPVCTLFAPTDFYRLIFHMIFPLIQFIHL